MTQVKRVKASERELLAAIRRTGTFDTIFGLVATAPAAPAKVNPFAKVPCAYGSESCTGKTFLPHGVGSTQHTTCAEGLTALALAKAGK